MSYIRPPNTTREAAARAILSRHADDYAFAQAGNWDGRGAVALSADVLVLARTILSRCTHGADPAEVAPGADGSLSFVWEDSGRTNYVYCDIGPGRTLHVYYNTAALGKWEAVSTVDNGDILRRLTDALRFVTPKPYEGIETGGAGYVLIAST